MPTLWYFHICISLYLFKFILSLCSPFDAQPPLLRSFFGFGFFFFPTQVGIWNYSPITWLPVAVTQRTWSCMVEVPTCLIWPAMNCAWTRCHGNQLRQL